MDDDRLLTDALELLEYATYHDGRYDQYKSQDWQRKAQKLVVVLAKRLDKIAYDGFGGRTK